ncbi:protein shisa-4 isoform X2 [Xenopus tropicalis]|uniref:Protein shisa-4 isoform X2 n=1 Tax=Xenopus tropicalis TaxID=8364 RepID=A0A8J0SRC8_XENTR|nr:protein shisa-4 isoform X2 [Xenopus tropicalis]|eukprot:XP_017946849.1 PREDICTED: protein shisa-4 isoform X2 [Xenopus tropicalis]
MCIQVMLFTSVQARTRPSITQPTSPSVCIICGGSWKMAAEVLGAAWILLCALSPLVLADNDCLWYEDRNGAWHPGFNCYVFSFCCGNCHERFCCMNPLQQISEREQKTCLPLSPKTMFGIGFAVVLFLVVIITLVCCFFCSCCYLYQRRHHRSTPHILSLAQEIHMSGIPQAQKQPIYPKQPSCPPYPVQPTYQMDPNLVPPQAGYGLVPVFQANGLSPQYPMYPPVQQPYNPNGPPPYMPYPNPVQPGM